MLAPILPQTQPDAALLSAAPAPRAQRVRPDAADARTQSRPAGARADAPSEPRSDRSQERSFGATLERAARPRADERTRDERAQADASRPSPTPAAEASLPENDAEATPRVESGPPADDRSTQESEGAPPAPGAPAPATDDAARPPTDASGANTPKEQPAQAATVANAPDAVPALPPDQPAAPATDTSSQRPARTTDAPRVPIPTPVGASNADGQAVNADARPNASTESDPNASSRTQRSKGAQAPDAAPRQTGSRTAAPTVPIQGEADEAATAQPNQRPPSDLPRVSEATRPSATPAQEQARADSEQSGDEARVRETGPSSDRREQADHSERAPRPFLTGGAATPAVAATAGSAPAIETAPEVDAPPNPAPQALRESGEPAPAPSVAQLQAAGSQNAAADSGDRQRDESRGQRSEPAVNAPGAPAKSAPPQHTPSSVDMSPSGEIRATSANPAQTTPSLTGGSRAGEMDEATLASAQRGLSVAMKQQGGSVQMRLTPESMGLLKIEMTIARGVVAATLQASTPEARELLGRNIETLRASLEAKGLSVERLTITLAPASQGGLGGQFSNANGGASQQPGANAGQHGATGDPSADHDASGERSKGWSEREQKRATHPEGERQASPDERLFQFRFGLHAIG